MQFTPANAAAAGSLGGIAAAQAAKTRPKRKSARYQVIELKEVALRDAIAESTPVGVRASLMRAYVDLHEIHMAIIGQGKPKPVEAKNAAPKKAKRETSAPIAPASGSGT